ncbi:hypothetical protein [Nocardioides panzhihuensis]|uniref:Uncharacterized protein n=1 Tax=Nocardioides panzhihuensis TaxID=860243 RepID=A0A7Z0DK87_9ACTN|nr:hypothetical protein [Nocardioides panzhihuensis]NYI76869.1 hypothetical protein [Nocardioides panzhihuensis]
MKLLVRLAVIVGGSLLYPIVLNLFPSEDANIGAGLLYFGLLFVVSGLWGLWDGRHAEALSPVFLRWTVVAIVTGLVFPIRIWSVEGVDFDVLWSDLAFLTPFVAGLVLAPAAAGIAIGKAVGSSDRELPRSTPQHPPL